MLWYDVIRLRKGLFIIYNGELGKLLQKIFPAPQDFVVKFNNPQTCSINLYFIRHKYSL